MLVGSLLHTSAFTSAAAQYPCVLDLLDEKKANYSIRT